ncbi:MAG: hypothetical protein R3362_09045 [Rhodothermales bacterium]|nr:hypothetical protein [Rhodothermales bacterium]
MTLSTLHRYSRGAAVVLLAGLLAGCATAYKPIPYDQLAYTGQQDSNGLAFSYRYDAVPGYYGKKLRKRGYSAVAVRVTNTTDAAVTLDRNSLRLLAGASPLQPLAPEIVADHADQPVWTYLLYGLLNLQIYSEDSSTFIPIGLPIALLNIIQSSSANRNAEKAYTEGYLLGQEVPPGGTVEGLLFVHETGYAPLRFEYASPQPAPPAPPAEPATAG